MQIGHICFEKFCNLVCKYATYVIKPRKNVPRQALGRTIIFCLEYFLNNTLVPEFDIQLRFMTIMYEILSSCIL